MKNLFLTVIFLFSGSVYSATCSSTTRSNYAPNAILTSSALNADFNQLITKANAMDAGCLTDGTLEFTALNATDFSPILNGIQQGCKVTYSDSNTISVGKCIATVNGNYIKTTSTNTGTWGCSGCSSEVVSTVYYAYIKNGSTATTLTVLISTTAPNEDGYDASSNKILARFFNNSASDIDQYTVEQWNVNRFAVSGYGWTSYTPTVVGGGTTPGSGDLTGFGTPTLTNVCKHRKVGGNLEMQCSFTTGATTVTIASLKLPNNLTVDTTKTIQNNTTAAPGDQIGSYYQTGIPNVAGAMVTANATSSSYVYMAGGEGTYTMLTPGYAITNFINTTIVNFRFSVPITGWLDL